MEKQIEKLTDLGTSAVQNAIAEYTQWLIVSSLCWLGFGLLCLVAAMTIWKYREGLEESSRVGAVILTAIAIIIVPLWLPTLISPRAYAIHQLVEDAGR